MNSPHLVLTVSMGLAMATAANGAPVHYVNTGLAHAWEMNIGCNSTSPSFGRRFYVDLLSAPSSQPLSDASLHNCSSSMPSGYVTVMMPHSPSGPNHNAMASLQGGCAYSAPYLKTRPANIPLLVSPPRSFAPNEPIGPDADWSPDAFSQMMSNGDQFFPNQSIVTGTGNWGFRFQIAGQTHYGYVTYRTRTVAPTSGRIVVRWDALAWGYENAPNTPILPNALPCVQGDVNGDLTVNTEDIVDFIGCFGSGHPTNIAVADINNDGAINTNDLVLLLSVFGNCTP